MVASTAGSSPIPEKPVRIGRLVLWLLVVGLVVDGLLRRLSPSSGGDLVLFLVKDGWCLGLWFVCLPQIFRHAPFRRWLSVALAGLAVMVLPSFFLTAVHDPWLALFGFKQRFLPLGVAVAVAAGAASSLVGPGGFARLCWGIGLLLLATGGLALWQTSLPVTHWLNCGPEGAPLPPEHVKAGIPRVSSSFPFFAQYAYFLTLALPVTLALVSFTRGTWKKVSLLAMAFVGMAGAYASNSRSAVFGPLLIVGCTVLAQLLWRDWKSLRMSGVFLLIMMTVPLFLDRCLPQAIAGYHFRAAKAVERSGGNVQDLSSRIVRESRPSRFLGGIDPSLFGGRLGSQSRGTETFSPWALEIRRALGWAENPLRAAYIETGWWGLISGTLARFALVGWLGWKVVRAGLPSGVTLPLFGTVALLAMGGGFDFQFPLACWFWLAVGLLVAELNWIGSRTGAAAS